MAFIRDATPPPNIKKGEELIAEIRSLDYPVESKFKDDAGNLKKQIKFNLDINGYWIPAWLSYYKYPGPRSKIAILCNSLMNVTNIKYETVGGFLEDLKKYKIYVKCVGHRTFNEQVYPKFWVVYTKIPPRAPVQTGLPQKISKKQTVRFIKAYENYKAGDIANLDGERADSLINLGFALPIDMTETEKITDNPEPESVIVRFLNAVPEFQWLGKTYGPYPKDTLATVPLGLSKQLKNAVIYL